MLPAPPIAHDRDVLLHAHELAQLGTWVWDVATNEVHWSDELFRQLGLTRETAPFRLERFLKYVHPDDREHVSGALAFAAASGAPFDHDYRVITARGQIRVINGRGSVLMDERGRAVRVIGTTRDITDRAHAERAMQRSEERFRGVFEQTLTGIAIFDGDCTLSQANAAFARFLGYAPGALVGKRLEEITHMEDHPIVNPCNRETFTSEARYVRRDGTIVWGRSCITPLRGDDGHLAGYMAAVEDITLSREVNEMLRRQVKVMHAVLDHMPLMVVAADEVGRVTFVNREFERVFGWGAAEAPAIDILAAAFPDAQERALALEAIRRGNPAWKRNEPLNRQGRKVPSSWACLNLPDGSTICIGRVAADGEESGALADLQTLVAEAPRAVLAS
jgi:PAS domain S-box-containing protein